VRLFGVLCRIFGSVLSLPRGNIGLGRGRRLLCRLGRGRRRVSRFRCFDHGVHGLSSRLLRSLGSRLIRGRGSRLLKGLGSRFIRGIGSRLNRGLGSRLLGRRLLGGLIRGLGRIRRCRGLRIGDVGRGLCHLRGGLCQLRCLPGLFFVLWCCILQSLFGCGGSLLRLLRGLVRLLGGLCGVLGGVLRLLRGLLGVGRSRRLRCRLGCGRRRVCRFRCFDHGVQGLVS